MSANERLRASETIRVFNLDCPQLQGNRRRAIEVYRSRNPGILEQLMDLDSNSREKYIDAEIAATRWDPYATTIKHLFAKVH